MRLHFSRQLSFSVCLDHPKLRLFSPDHLIISRSICCPKVQFLNACRLSTKLSRTFYLFLLNGSISRGVVFSVKAHASKSGYQHDLILSTAVMSSLVKLGDVIGGRKLFDEMPIKDVAAWNAMLSGYAQNGFLFDGISFFRLMCSHCTAPNSLTLSVLLQICSAFDDCKLGRSIHGYAYRKLGLRDTFLGNSLIVFYNKNGVVYASENVLESMPRRDIASWNAMISGYMQFGCPWKSLEALELLRQEGLHPDLVTLETALQACARIGKDAMFDGKLIHGLLIKLGYKMNVYAENCLLLMYCKCGMVLFGRSLFDKMETRNSVSWNIVVNGYVHINCPGNALDLFVHAHSVEAEISSDLLVSTLQAARLIRKRRELVLSLHCLVVRMGFDFDLYISSALISAYGDACEVEYARSYFDYIFCAVNSRTACWNAMISVYFQHGFLSKAVELVGIELLYDAFSIVNILSLCCRLLGLKSGKEVHGYVIRNRFESDVFVATSLMQFYITYGLLHAACQIFSRMPRMNIVSWNTMIIGCVRLGFPVESLNLFFLMQQKDGFMPDATSVVGAIEAISYRGFETERNFIHEYAIENGFIDDEYVTNSLISLHSRFHDLSKASMVFDRANKVSVVTWNTMIAEYCNHGLMDGVILTFELMRLNGIKPDKVTILCLLQVCLARASLKAITAVQAISCKSGHESDAFVGSAIVNAYSKCGKLRMAFQFFHDMTLRTSVSWNSMMQGYGLHGKVVEANNLFLQMQKSGFHPTAVTFLLLLSACSHAGDAEKGLYYLHLMMKGYSLHPRYEHLSSFIGLLGRSGFTEEAYKLSVSIPKDFGVFCWGSFLGACQIQGKMNMGLAAAEKLFEMVPFHQGYHVLVSNMLAGSGRWTDAYLLRTKADKMGARKEIAWSMVEV
ncbi:hypothetical protein HPP92_000707 [Vanilla planifolia]|uniref:Pentatricopeptide repeat-containing protein n=1 Tax=Vanilla planifolia TaxID=51239 RepID=A0A835VKQ2_VANPL|nr:hypothetical protein HPP92_000707 [Vanilla planifolia]